MKNIFLHANGIINTRSEEKERQYGPIDESLFRACKIYEGMTGQNIELKNMYKMLVALKLSRESYAHKYDNILDAIAYLGALSNFEERKTK